MATWRADIVKALEQSGGEASLADIYALVKNYRGKVPPSYQAMIRGSIEAASSDSEVWHKKKTKTQDLFYSVNGIGGGIWGLRSIQHKSPAIAKVAISDSDGEVAQLEDSVPATSVTNTTRVKVDTRSRERLPAEDFKKITAEHIWNAIQKLLNGRSNDEYEESTGFDLITDEGARLPPKAVFGLAATEALGFKVLPKHFSGGVGTPCFRMLVSAGYMIVLKDASVATGDGNYGGIKQVVSKYWVEGKKKAAVHIRRERKSGLAIAKKAQFRRLHGKLRCERCGFDPVAIYGEAFGEASIEVHHKATQVKNMKEGHITKLEDLQCLCANCHRVTHRELKLEII